MAAPAGGAGVAKPKLASRSTAFTSGFTQLSREPTELGALEARAERERARQRFRHRYLKASLKYEVHFVEQLGKRVEKARYANWWRGINRAAIMIQRIVRGFVARRKVQRMPPRKPRSKVDLDLASLPQPPADMDHRPRRGEYEISPLASDAAGTGGTSGGADDDPGTGHTGRDAADFVQAVTEEASEDVVEGKRRLRFFEPDVYYHSDPRNRTLANAPRGFFAATDNLKRQIAVKRGGQKRALALEERMALEFRWRKAATAIQRIVRGFLGRRVDFKAAVPEELWSTSFISFGDSRADMEVLRHGRVRAGIGADARGRAGARAAQGAQIRRVMRGRGQHRNHLFAHAARTGDDFGGDDHEGRRAWRYRPASAPGEGGGSGEGGPGLGRGKLTSLTIPDQDRSPGYFGSFAGGARSAVGQGSFGFNDDARSVLSGGTSVAGHRTLVAQRRAGSRRQFSSNRSVISHGSASHARGLRHGYGSRHSASGADGDSGDSGDDGEDHDPETAEEKAARLVGTVGKGVARRARRARLARDRTLKGIPGLPAIAGPPRATRIVARRSSIDNVRDLHSARLPLLALREGGGHAGGAGGTVAAASKGAGGLGVAVATITRDPELRARAPDATEPPHELAEFYVPPPPFQGTSHNEAVAQRAAAARAHLVVPGARRFNTRNAERNAGEVHKTDYMTDAEGHNSELRAHVNRVRRHEGRRGREARKRKVAATASRRVIHVGGLGRDHGRFGGGSHTDVDYGAESRRMAEAVRRKHAHAKLQDEYPEATPSMLEVIREHHHEKAMAQRFGVASGVMDKRREAAIRRADEEATQKAIVEAKREAAQKAVAEAFAMKTAADTRKEGRKTDAVLKKAAAQAKATVHGDDARTRGSGASALSPKSKMGSKAGSKAASSATTRRTSKRASRRTSTVTTDSHERALREEAERVAAEAQRLQEEADAEEEALAAKERAREAREAAKRAAADAEAKRKADEEAAGITRVKNFVKQASSRKTMLGAFDDEAEKARVRQTLYDSHALGDSTLTELKGMAKEKGIETEGLNRLRLMSKVAEAMGNPIVEDERRKAREDRVKRSEATAPIIGMSTRALLKQFARFGAKPPPSWGWKVDLVEALVGPGGVVEQWRERRKRDYGNHPVAAVETDKLRVRAARIGVLRKATSTYAAELSGLMTAEDERLDLVEAVAKEMESRLAEKTARWETHELWRLSADQMAAKMREEGTKPPPMPGMFETEKKLVMIKVLADKLKRRRAEYDDLVDEHVPDVDWELHELQPSKGTPSMWDLTKGKRPVLRTRTDALKYLHSIGAYGCTRDNCTCVFQLGELGNKLDV